MPVCKGIAASKGIYGNMIPGGYHLYYINHILGPAQLSVCLRLLIVQISLKA